MSLREGVSTVRPSSAQIRPRANELLSAAYRSPPEAFWAFAKLRGEDGYKRIELAIARGWEAIPSWGLRGWDLGTWPWVVILHRTTPTAYELAYNVEGDISVYRYVTRELRDTATDYVAFWHWKNAGEPWVDAIENVDVAPAYLRGPFSLHRLEASRAGLT
jgi:hypothetical protein